MQYQQVKISKDIFLFLKEFYHVHQRTIKKAFDSINVRTSFNRINGICAQYLGSNQKEKANQALKQLIFSITLISILITLPCILFRRPLLSLIFGSVEKNVMDNSLSYLFITALSYPFIALYNAGAASFRTSQNSRLPMAIAFGSNILNIIGNVFFIFTLSLGVAGAALSTLLSRIISAAI